MSSANYTWPANESRLYIAGIELFLISDVTGEDAYGLEKVSGIGQIEGLDLVPMEATYRINVAGFVTRTTELVTKGIWPIDAQAVMNGKYVTIEIFQKDPAILLKKYEQCKFETGSAIQTAHRQLMMRMTFQALKSGGTFTQ